MRTRLLALPIAFATMLGAVRADPPKAEDKLGPGEYRVKVETSREPTDDTAVYRVQVWTVGKQTVRLTGYGGEPRPEADGKLHRTEYVIVVILRPHPNPEVRGKKLELEQRILGRSGPGGLFLKNAVAPDTKLASAATIADGTHTRRIGDKVAIGKLNGDAIEVEVEKPK
jgi:hypothetical protein